MSNQIKNVTSIVNGDRVIGFTSTMKVRDLGWMDRSSMASWYQEDYNKNHLGLMELFTNFSGVNIPVTKNLWQKSAVLEVNGMDGSFRYDLPVVKPTGTFVMKDTSGDYEYAGIDESVFALALSKPYRQGDVLSYDVKYGEQVIVSNDHEVIQDGDVYIHMVRLVSNDKRAWYPSEKLKAGIQYFKVGHVLTEYDTQYSNIESPDNVGTMTCEFVLGNHRGVETNYTMYADKKNFSGAMSRSKDYWNMVTNEMEKFKDDMGRTLDMMYIGKINPRTGKMNGNSVSIGSTLEYLVILENMKLEANQLMFQKGGIIKSNNGVKRLNEGAYHQIRRGRKISYSRAGGITREHIRQAAAYIFQGREDLLPMERVLTFKAGYGAYQNMMAIFRDEFNAQLSNLSAFLGTDRRIPNPVGGTLDALTLAPVMISQVPIPDIGIVKVEYDPSLNYHPAADRASRGMYGQGHSKDSYTLMIWDAGDSAYSNARTNLPTGTELMHGGSKNENIYYVKPEGEHMWWGFEQGRWSPNKASEIMSSVKTMSREFWVHSTSACWIRDISRFLVIELKR